MGGGNAVSPSDYFEVVLPTILRWKGPAAAALGVNVRFVVTGRGGGTWTVRLRPPMAGVVQGSEWKADLIIRKHRPFSEAEFSRREATDFFGVRLAIASVEDVILSK